MFYSSEFEADNNNNNSDDFVVYNEDWVEEQQEDGSSGNKSNSTYESPSVWNKSQLNDLPQSHFQHTREDNPLVSDICRRFEALRSDLTRVHPNGKPVTNKSPFEALNLNGHHDRYDDDGGNGNLYYVKYGGHLSGHGNIDNNDDGDDGHSYSYEGYVNSDLDSDTLSAIHPGESLGYIMPNYNSPHPVGHYYSSSSSATYSPNTAAATTPNSNNHPIASSSSLPKKRNPAYYGKVKLQSRLTKTKFTDEMPEIENSSLSFTPNNRNNNNSKTSITPKPLSIPPEATHLFFQDPLPYSSKAALNTNNGSNLNDSLLHYVAPAAEKPSKTMTAATHSNNNNTPRVSLVSRQSSVSSLFPKADRVVKKLGLASASKSSSMVSLNNDVSGGTGAGNVQGLKSKKLRFKVPVEVEELHAVKKKYLLTRRNASLELV